MLMGYKCATQNVTLEPEDLTEAMRRVRSFAFVGITEYYTESVCLFHRMFGGAIHPDELSNLRYGRGTAKNRCQAYTLTFRWVP